MDNCTTNFKWVTSDRSPGSLLSRVTDHDIIFGIGWDCYCVHVHADSFNGEEMVKC